MSGIFLAALLLLAAAFASVVVQGRQQAAPDAVVQVARITRLPGLALSVTYLEPRCRELRDYSDAHFPGMRPVSYLDDVYAR